MSLLKKTIFIFSIAVTSGLHFSVWSADIEAGKAKSVSCNACHGSKGVSMIPMYPNLAGQKAQYLVLQLKAFRDGERKNMLMSPMVSGLTDTDIENLAAYYASLDPSGK
ncbi:MAG: cytochrome c [Paraglaciecola sp.]|uniref:c-type cytochrome n=1 Tax=Paraglaciecola sp. TaxID=1920173 RepID=UPI00273D7EAA|nr:cytochrome c [Paraglaciecola sp.]MDP5033141.1 cytochrome c [Paraglaciecola sp.]MDP5039756.1 cytochrome c [Paraglaciecola sp.]MDP5130213.1 cytochrome c [Paraglaciecola sp.]